ncbi:MAG TPA: hypothetical protein VF528_18960 [Pyrinomonadaceae bacterium]|jgi:hypothetical protein
MKRVTQLLLALILCLCAAQMAFAQRDAQAPIEPIDPCYDCEPPPPTCGPNPIDDATFFVQQQYRDFLYRNPQGYELASDVAPLNSCLHYGDLACYNTERVKMSRRMWDKPEFRQQSRTFGLSNTSGNELYDTYDFVELSYLIYLQRSSSAPPDDYRRLGFWFWKGSLDSCLDRAANQYGNDPVQVSQCYNDIINAFLSSTEYRSRFGCP